MSQPRSFGSSATRRGSQRRAQTLPGKRSVGASRSSAIANRSGFTRRGQTSEVAPSAPRFERYASPTRTPRSQHSALSSTLKSRGVSSTRSATPGRALATSRAAGITGGIDLAYSNSGRDGYERAGLSIGADGVRAYYDRNRFDHADDISFHRSVHHVGSFHDHYSHYDDHSFGTHLFGGLLHGAFHHGHYYPYGYVSYYDTYYHRYPYDYLAVCDYSPNWVVYVDPPVQTIYVESPSASVDVVGPSPLANAPATRTTIEVEPQERIPVNNAWLAGGEKAFRDGDYGQALRSFSYAVLESPGDGFAELAYALAHFAQGAYQPAADAIRRGLALVPDVIDRPMDITRQYGDRDALRAHLAALDAHVKANPTDADAWFVLGYVRFSTGQPTEAATAFGRAASLNDNDPYAAILRDAAERVTVR